MKVTSEQVISMFEKYCDKYGKIFIAEPRQTAIVDNLIKHYERFYSIEVLEMTIDYFIKAYPEEAILIFDFALKSAKYRDKAIESKTDADEISKLMQETKERMSRYQ